MPDFLTAPFNHGPHVVPLQVLIRLLVALALGGVIAGIYRRTRKSTEIIASFPTTLILLAILIAMVTQVIGDNIARAFSLVGALSIVRFRTVVRDTQDTAYVILAVIVGMAVGAESLWVAAIGILIVGAASFWRQARLRRLPDAQPAFLLTLRVPAGIDPNQLASSTLDAHLQERELLAIGTAKQGAAVEFVYESRLQAGGSPTQLVQALQQVEGVQSVQFKRRGVELN